METIIVSVLTAMLIIVVFLLMWAAYVLVKLERTTIKSDEKIGNEYKQQEYLIKKDGIYYHSPITGIITNISDNADYKISFSNEDSLITDNSSKKTT